MPRGGLCPVPQIINLEYRFYNVTDKFLGNNMQVKQYHLGDLPENSLQSIIG